MSAGNKQSAARSEATKRCISTALLMATLLCTSTTARARSTFESQLDLELAVTTPVITNKFGFATSFPKPADGGTNPRKSWWDDIAGAGGAVIKNPAPVVAERKKVAKGRGMKLHVGGGTIAAPVNGAVVQAKGSASGRARIRLGNFTGRGPDFPAPENLTIDLSLTALRSLTAIAHPDVDNWDWAHANYSWEVTNTSTGDSLALSPAGTIVDVSESGSMGIPFGADPGGPLSVTLPPDTFYNIDLVGHVFAAGYSAGMNPPVPNPPTPGLPELEDEALDEFNNGQLGLVALNTALFGDANGFGGGALGDVAGVTGEDALARAGRDTVMTEQVLFAGDEFFDVVYEIETPVNNFSQVAIDEMVINGGGMHTQFLDLQIGTGSGDEFQMSLDPLMLSFTGQASELPPQEIGGSYNLLGANDPFVPTQLGFQGQTLPGQPALFELGANLHDAADGVIDGMARFTLRKFVGGLSGDFTGDGVVDHQDYALWQELHGTNDLLADANLDGVVGPADYTVWRDSLARFGDGGGVFATASVPEPSAAVLVLLSAVPVAMARKRD